MIYLERNDSTNIFSIWLKIKVPLSQNLKSQIKSENFKKLENEVYLSWFFNPTRLQKSFSILRRDQRPPPQALKSENFQNHKIGFIFHDFFSTIQLHEYFLDLAARSQCRYLKIKFWIFLIGYKLGLISYYFYSPVRKNQYFLI